jgi:hypothetical protein
VAGQKIEYARSLKTSSEINRDPKTVVFQQPVQACMVEAPGFSPASDGIEIVRL